MPAKAPKEAGKMQAHCPFCDEEVVKAQFPYCRSCGVTLKYCQQCGQPVARSKRVCPNCGARIVKST